MGQINLLRNYSYSLGQQAERNLLETITYIYRFDWPDERIREKLIFCLLRLTLCLRSPNLNIYAQSMIVETRY